MPDEFVSCEIDQKPHKLLPRGLGIILFVACLVRLTAALAITSYLSQVGRDFLIEGDANGYWELAQKLVAGEDYSLHTPPRYVLRTPGFPAVLAVPIALFGDSWLIARIWLAIWGTAAVWVTFLLGQRLVNTQAGLIAALVAAFSPAFVIFSTLILTETVFAVSVLLSLWFGERVVATLRPSSVCGKGLVLRAFLAGASIGLACLVRPSWIFAAPIFGGLILLISPHRLHAFLAAGLICAGTVLTLLPWGLRNQQVTGHFTLTTFWAGPSLYDGLNPNANGDSDMRFFDADSERAHMSEYEVDQKYKRLAWKFVKEHPQRTLELAFLKQARYWNPVPNAEQFQRWWIKIPFLLWYCLIAVFTCIGVWSQRKRIWTLVICLGPVIYFAAIHSIFVGSIRYRLPAEYPLLILTSAGIAATYQHWFRSKTVTEADHS